MQRQESRPPPIIETRPVPKQKTARDGVWRLPPCWTCIPQPKQNGEAVEQEEKKNVVESPLLPLPGLYRISDWPENPPLARAQRRPISVR